MFDFKDELTKFRKSLETGDLSEGVSGDEIRDILDVAKELVNARAAGYDQPPMESAREPEFVQEEEAAAPKDAEMTEETSANDEEAESVMPEAADTDAAVEVKNGEIL